MSIESVSSISPLGSPLPALRAAAMTCHACPLWRNATQTVFGEGPLHAPPPNVPSIMATFHPASILRARDEETRQTETLRFIADLRAAATLAGL
jgi:uracil-DNA glycosylase